MSANDDTGIRPFTEELFAAAPPEVLAEADRRIAARLSEVRPDCLKPDDLVEYQRTGFLQPEMELHLEQCTSCADLLRPVPPGRLADLRPKAAEPGVARVPARFPGLNWSGIVASVAICGLVVMTVIGPRTPVVNAAPVVVVARAAQNVTRIPLPGTSITVVGKVDDENVKAAAAVAALSVHPPEVKFEGMSPDVSLEARKRVVMLTAMAYPRWQEAKDSQQQLTMLRDLTKEKWPGMKVTSDGPDGVFLVSYVVDGSNVTTQWDLGKTAEAAQQNDIILRQAWLNKTVASVQPVQLNGNLTVSLAVSTSQPF